MAPQSYELSFVGSLLLIIFCILLTVLAANLIVSILRYTLSYVLGIISPETASRGLVESATQTQAGDCDDNVVKSQSGEKQVEVSSAAGGEGKKKD